MRKHPRRTLLGGIGSTVAIAAAGCLSITDDTDDSPSDSDDDETGDESDADLAALLEYVPASIDGPLNLATADLDRLADAETAGPGVAFGWGTAPLQQWGGGDTSAVSRSVVVERNETFSTPLVVLAIDDDAGPDALGLGADVTLESREHDSGTSYERGTIDGGDGVIALVDDVALVAESGETIDAALDAAAGDATLLIEARPALEAGLERFADADTKILTLNDEVASEFELDADGFRYAAFATTVLDADTVEYTSAVELESESLVTDDRLATFEERFDAFPPQHSSDVVVDADGAVMMATWTVDLEAQRRAAEHDSPSGVKVETVDPDAEYVSARVTHADPTPVDELTIEIDGDAYDEAIWADGQEQIEEGDTIRLETALLEPNLPVTIIHEADNFTASVTTRLLSHFRFDFDHDPDAGTVTIRYEDEYPLDGDDVIVAVHDVDAEPYQYDDTDEPMQTATPWDGTTLSAGDETTLNGLEPGMRITVGWQGTTFEDAIASTRIRPPGQPHVDYEYETNTLTVELGFEDDGTEPADAYELLIDDEPAPAQWRDTAETVSDGATVVVDDVDVGSNVIVTWGDGVQVGGGSATPSLEVTADLEDGDLVLAHDGGPELPASNLSAEVYRRDGPTTIALDTVTDGTFADGDAVTLLEDLETDSDSLSVSVLYDGHWITSAFAEA